MSLNTKGKILVIVLSVFMLSVLIAIIVASYTKENAESTAVSAVSSSQAGDGQAVAETLSSDSTAETSTEPTAATETAATTEAATTTEATTTTEPVTEPPQPETEPLMPPYDGKRYEVNDATLGGIKYNNSAIISGSEGDSVIAYNLGGNYSRLEFDIGHVDGSSVCNASYSVLLDNEEFQVLELKGDDLPVHVDLDVTNVKQFKVKIVKDSFSALSSAKYAIVNGTLYK